MLVTVVNNIFMYVSAPYSDLQYYLPTLIPLPDASGINRLVSIATDVGMAITNSALSSGE